MMTRRRKGSFSVGLLVLVIAIVAVVYLLPRLSPSTPAVPPPGASGSWYQLYFTEPRYPDDPKNHQGGIDEKLVALMDRAQRTLDVADYDFDLKNVADAMARAKQRGVPVRMVTDTDILSNKDADIQAAFKVLKSADIPIVDDQRPPIMHDKYTIVDGEWVSTGSWNYTDGDTYHLNNWMGVFHSKELAANYTADFEEMFIRHQFASAKKAVPNRSVVVEGDSVQNCFSPQDGCAEVIITTLKASAEKSVSFMAFSFTHNGIGNALLEKAKAGTKVQGVFETTGSQTPFSEYTRMKKAGLEVYTDGNPWVMHHKVMIVDDRLVIAGSFNFSANADKDNDENLLIFDDPSIAKLFTAEYDKVLAQAKNPPAKKSGGTREKP